MTNSVQRLTTDNNFEPDECIRVVPLHYPKPTISPVTPTPGPKAGVVDLFGDQPVPAVTTAELTYRNGPLLTNVELFTVFWGTLWGSTSTSTDLMDKLNTFFADIVVSSLLDQLAEYDVPSQAIGHGSFAGTKIISDNAPVGSVTDSAIQAQLEGWIAAGTLPANDKNSLYFVFLDPGVVSVMGGSRSCQSYCGYHSSGQIYYAVTPYPSCDGCLGGLQVFDAMTAVSSHELCEAITDPVPGSGWYDDTNGEIGDICAWNFKTVAGYTVQLEWSNQRNQCV